MMEPRNKVVRVGRFGDPGGLEVVNAPMPMATLPPTTILEASAKPGRQ
jgi:hypothetical protein